MKNKQDGASKEENNANIIRLPTPKQTKFSPGKINGTTPPTR
jgi:hypothetical protein